MSAKLKILTVIGTRPEIIRLSETMKLLDALYDHVIVHTGQNYDYSLNEVFFENLGLRTPDYFLKSDTTSLGSTLGSILEKVEPVLLTEKPDAMLVLGDTNSCIAAIMGKRLGVPVYHMEAGNRSFDPNVPEETNRKIVDHVADYNLVYSEHARRNLLAEGISPQSIHLTGSPMYEVINANRVEIESSRALEKLKLKKNNYFLASLHRQENVDNEKKLMGAMRSFESLSQQFGFPVLLSTHPRTKLRLTNLGHRWNENVILHEPFGFHDYLRLQTDAKLVLSDSGTISEESAILGFPAITMREAIERPEGQDQGLLILTGVEPERVTNAVESTLHIFETFGPGVSPGVYGIPDVSRRVATFIESTALSHFERNSLRVDGQARGN